MHFISCFLLKPPSTLLPYLKCDGNKLLILFFFFFQSTQKGTEGFEQHIDKCLDLSAYLYNKIKNREGYEMVFDGEVRSLFPHTANLFQMNTQIFTVLSYQMNINHNPVDTQDDQLQQQRKTVYTILIWAFSFVMNDYNNIFNILTWV